MLRILRCWKDKPVKVSHKGRHARCTLKLTKAEPHNDGTYSPMGLAILFFDYRLHLYSDRKLQLIRRWRPPLSLPVMGPDCKIEAIRRPLSGPTQRIGQKPTQPSWKKQGLVSNGQRKKPHCQPMPQHVQRSNAGKSVIRKHVRC